MANKHADSWWLEPQLELGSKSQVQLQIQVGAYVNAHLILKLLVLRQQQHGSHRIRFFLVCQSKIQFRSISWLSASNGTHQILKVNHFYEGTPNTPRPTPFLLPNPVSPLPPPPPILSLLVEKKMPNLFFSKRETGNILKFWVGALSNLVVAPTSIQVLGNF